MGRSSTTAGQSTQVQSPPSSSSGSGGSSGSESVPQMPQLGPGGPSGSQDGTQGGSQGGSPFGGQSSSGGTDTTSATGATDTQEAGLVYINTSVDYGEAEAAGTGMILTSDGTILTNHHVIEGATKIEVQVISTGKTYTASVVGYDDTHDVAVLKLKDASGLTAVNLDTSGDLAVGDSVTAVGNANGDGGDASAAAGTVTALNQTITVTNDDNTQSTLNGLIQIDADVISGDSGGAVYNSSGEVVGMTTAATSGSADVSGYAIPIAEAIKIGDQILAGKESGSVNVGGTAFLGITLSNQTTSPTVYSLIDDSPAEKAGITAGSTIVSVGGTSITSASQLSSKLKSYNPGDRVTVAWTDAAGSSHSATITLTTGPVG